MDEESGEVQPPPLPPRNTTDNVLIGEESGKAQPPPLPPRKKTDDVPVARSSRNENYAAIPLLDYVGRAQVAKVSLPTDSVLQPTCYCTRFTMMHAFGSFANPLVFEGITLNDVRIQYDPRLFVVFRNATLLNVEETNVGRNVMSEGCERTMNSTMASVSEQIQIDGFGTAKFPLVFVEQTFVRCNIDCNNLAVWFVKCTFIECVFTDADNVNVIQCKHKTSPHEHIDSPCYRFFVYIDDVRYMWGYVAPAGYQDEHVYAVDRAEPTLHPVRRWATKLKTHVARTKSGRLLLEMVQRPSSRALSVAGPSPSLNQSTNGSRPASGRQFDSQHQLQGATPTPLPTPTPTPMPGYSTSA